MIMLHERYKYPLKTRFRKDTHLDTHSALTADIVFATWSGGFHGSDRNAVRTMATQ